MPGRKKGQPKGSLLWDKTNSALRREECTPLSDDQRHSISNLESIGKGLTEGGEDNREDENHSQRERKLSLSTEIRLTIEERKWKGKTGLDLIMRAANVPQN